MVGQVHSGRQKLAGVRVEVFTDSVTRLMITNTDSFNRAEFLLPLQNIYLVKFIKHGYVTKKITINTRMPKK